MAAAVVNGLLCRLARVTIGHHAHGRLLHAGSNLLIRATPSLFAEPMKKKKKIDPGVVLARENRKKRRLEKEIRRLEKHARKLKPIEEVVGDWSIIKTAAQRKRDDAPVLDYAESERRALLFKEWSSYQLKQHSKETKKVEAMIASQTHALEELRKESEALYKMAVQVDTSLIPFKRKGPVETPPIGNYGILDGEYVETTKSY